MGIPEHPHKYAWNRYIGAVIFKFYSIEFHSIGDGRLSAVCGGIEQLTVEHLPRRHHATRCVPQPGAPYAAPTVGIVLSGGAPCLIDELLNDVDEPSPRPNQTNLGLREKRRRNHLPPCFVAL